MRKYFFLILIIVCAAGSSFADIGAVLRNGTGARSAAMGLAQVAAVAGSDGIYWNPASLADCDTAKFSSTAAEIYGTSYKSLSAAAAAWGGGFGIMVFSADQGGIPETSLDVSDRPIVNGYFSYSSRALYLCYARKIGKVSIGSNIKYLSEGLADNSASGVGGDIGVLLGLSDRLAIGAKVENAIAPQMKWDTSTQATDGVGTCYQVGVKARPSSGNLLLCGDLRFGQKNTEIFLGSEYQLDLLALRCGIFDNRFSLGLGFNYHDFETDYSFVQGNDYLEGSHRVSLSLSL